MARRSDHSREEIKELSLKATEQIVAEAGFTALSARKIAAAIGYTVGTLYLVFENLDDLIMQVNTRTLDKLHSELNKTLKSGTHSENLHQLGQTYYAFAVENPHLWSLIFEHHVAGGGELLESLSNRITSLFTVIETELKHLAPHKDQQSIHSAAISLWSSVHGITILSVSNKLFMANKVTPAEMIDLQIENFLKGYLSPS